jgi:hypothetical protein
MSEREERDRERERERDRDRERRRAALPASSTFSPPGGVQA